MKIGHRAHIIMGFLTDVAVFSELASLGQISCCLEDGFHKASRCFVTLFSSGGCTLSRSCSELWWASYGGGGSGSRC